LLIARGARGGGGVHGAATDRNGWIEISTNGEQLWVEVENR